MDRPLASGKEFSLDEREEWSTIAPLPGLIVEVDMLRTNRTVNAVVECWAAFFIRGVSNEMDGSYVLEVNYLGCKEEGEHAALTLLFKSGVKHIHLCLGVPCVVVGGMEAIHATAIRLWAVEDFDAEYVEKHVWKTLKLWQKEGRCSRCSEKTGTRASKAQERAEEVQKEGWRRGRKTEGQKRKGSGRGHKVKVAREVEEGQRITSGWWRSREEPCCGSVRLGRGWRRWIGQRFYRLLTYSSAEHRFDAGGEWPEETTLEREGPFRKGRDSSPVQGYKRTFYSGLDRPIGGEGSRCPRRAGEEQEEGQEEEQSGPGSEPVTADPYGEIGEERGSEWREEEEKEKAKVEEWSDCEFEQQFKELLRGDGGGEQRRSKFRRRLGGATTQEEPRFPRKRAVTSDRARQGTNAARCRHRSWRTGSPCHRRGEADYVLQHARAAELWRSPERAEGDVHALSDNRSPEEGGPSQGRRQPVRPLHGAPSILGGPVMEHGAAHGALPHGGSDGGFLCPHPGVEEAWPPRGQGAGQRKLGFLARQGKARKTKRLGNMVRSTAKRSKGQRAPEQRKGQGEEPLGERRREESQRVGKEQGCGRPGKVAGQQEAALVTAVRSSGSPATDPPATWADILLSCPTLGHAGCSLAWLLVQAPLIAQLHGNSSFLDGIYASGAWPQARRSRRAFPVREGEFGALRSILEKASLADVREEGFVAKWAETAWTMAACFSCNSLAGHQRPFLVGSWSKPERKLVKAVGLSVKRLMGHGQAEHRDFVALEKELRSKRVNYAGDEVGVCHEITMAQVVPSLPLPEHGGSIDILKFVSESTRYFLRNPQKMVVEDCGQELPKLQGKLHIEKGMELKLGKELVSRGVCCWVPMEKVLCFRGQKVLNGLFGVEKSTRLATGQSVLRLIVMVPTVEFQLGRVWTGAWMLGTRTLCFGMLGAP